MTVKDAIDNGIAQVRRPEWNPYAHLDLPVKDNNGLSGPWAYLVDPCSNRALGRPAEEKIALLTFKVPGQLLCLDPNDDNYEPWKRPEDYDRLLVN